MKIIQAHTASQDNIESLNRCRGNLEVIFFSDITTANRLCLEHSAVRYTGKKASRLTYKFPCEQPTTPDWKVWEEFWNSCTGKKVSRSTYKIPPGQPTTMDWKVWEKIWNSCTGTGYKLAMPLGKSINPTHRK
jgi:hypothetical protein